MPRVLRVLTRLNIGGPSRHATILHRGLAGRGWDCVLAAGTPDPGEGDFASWAPDVEVTRVPGLRRGAGPAGAAVAIATVSRLVRRLRPDVVHTHMAMAGFTGRVAALGSGAVRVHTFHGHVLEGYFSARRERLYTGIERALARATDALVAVSPAVRDDLLARGVGTTPSKWRVVQLGLDLDTLLALPAGLPRTRAVGIVGRLVPIKDHETFLRAAAHLPDDVTFVVAGDGALRPDLERRAAQLGLGGRVRFLGWVPDLPALYSSLDAVVLTSLNEGTPVAVIEAMAAARPVVATAVGGVPDVVEDGRTGLLVAPRDARGIAAAVRSVLEDPALASRLGQAGRATAARYASVHLVDAVDALYRELIARRG